MFRATARSLPRRAFSAKSLRYRASRSITTAPPAERSRSWKNSALRWGIAGVGVYYYNTSNLFAEETEAAVQHLDESIYHIQESRLPTLEEITQEKRLRAAPKPDDHKDAEAVAPEKEDADKESMTAHAEDIQDGPIEDGSLEHLEEEAGQQQAFNPETGEINWDCPCLGGMAHGPCGEEFKAAFSCFIYSTDEPKGVECIEKFKGMQDCFREHPDMYGSELEDDEEMIEAELNADGAEQDPSRPVASVPAPEPEKDARTDVKADKDTATPVDAAPADAHRDSLSTTAAESQTGGDEGGDLLPKAVHDATRE